MGTEPVSPAFNGLLDRFLDYEPGATKKIQELRASMDAKKFLLHIRAAIEEKPPSSGLRLPASLVNIQDIVQMLLEVYSQSKERAVALARKLVLGDPQFDAKLLHCFSDRDSRDWPDEAILIALDILDAVSERDRLVLAASTLLRHPNPKLRSKAALFIARRRPALTWIADLSGHSDARIKANIIEGLYGSQEDFIAPLFRKHVHDENNRVAGNAILGLYRVGDLDSIRMMDEMAVDQRPGFRVTSAWIMGQTGDPRFSAILAGQLSDTHLKVRQVALHALGEMRKSVAEARSREHLHLAILRCQANREGTSLVATVCAESDAPVRAIQATGFLLKVGGNYVRRYRVHEYSAEGPVHAALIMCLPEEGENAVSAAFDEATTRCHPLLRKKDDFVVTRISHETNLRCSATEVSESNAILRKALREINFGLLNLNLIVVGASRCTRVLERFFELAPNLHPKLHVIAISPEWQAPELRQRTLGLDGYFRTATPSTVNQACFEAFSSLLHHYQVNWKELEASVELEIRSQKGTALASFDLGTTSHRAPTAAPGPHEPDGERTEPQICLQ